MKKSKIKGIAVGALLGFLLGLSPGIDDAFEKTHYAEQQGLSSLIIAFLPIAIVGAIVCGLLGFLVVIYADRSKHNLRPEGLPAGQNDTSDPQERSTWPPPPKSP